MPKGEMRRKTNKLDRSDEKLTKIDKYNKFKKNMFLIRGK